MLTTFAKIVFVKIFGSCCGGVPNSPKSIHFLQTRISFSGVVVTWPCGCHTLGLLWTSQCSRQNPSKTFQSSFYLPLLVSLANKPNKLRNYIDGCICLSCKTHLSKEQNVFVLNLKCISTTCWMYFFKLQNDEGKSEQLIVCQLWFISLPTS